MVMPYYLSEYPHQILPLPQAVEELKQKGKKKGKAVAFFWYNRHILSFILSVFQPDIERIVYAVALLHPC